MPDGKRDDQVSPSESHPRDYDERTSLHPLSTEEALRALLAVKVPSDEADPSPEDDEQVSRSLAPEREAM